MLGEMRDDMGVRGVLVYCADYNCSHSMAMNADRWPDDVRLSEIEPRFVCPDPSQLPPVSRSAACVLAGDPKGECSHAYPADMGISCADLVVSGHRPDSDCSYGPLACS